MRLVDLNPSWTHWAHDAIGRDGREAIPHTSNSKAIGCRFDCPVHGKLHDVRVDFANPFDGADVVTRNHLWTRTGDTFETLSLSPSVDYTKYDNGELRDASCWHGFVTNGEVK